METENVGKKRMQYYGIDWLATVCGLTGVFLLGSKNKYGFLVLMLARLSWMSVGLMIASVPLIFGCVVSSRCTSEVG